MIRFVTSCTALMLLAVTSLHAQVVKVQIKQTSPGHYQLLRGGQPYLIKGAGGDGDKQLMADLGGNAFRTWGVGRGTKALLDEAQQLGLTVTLGLWLGHERHGFDYTNQDSLKEQTAMVRDAVMKYKNHPALLAWGLGNEMEGYAEGDNPNIWNHIQKLAAMVKQMDPNHPTMTVIAEIGGKRVQSINQLCPDIDIIGINTYGGVASIPARYRAAGGTKPYVLSEYGPPGIWEIGKNSFGTVNELTSTQKADRYREAYLKAIKAEEGKLCLGGYAFTWGFKQEATATWFGMLMPDGTKTQAVDVMAQMWAGKYPPNRCPEIVSYKIEGADQVNTGDQVIAVIKTTDPENDSCTVEWQFHEEAKKLNTGGDAEEATKQYPEAIIASNNQQVTLKMPNIPGIYRIFAIVRDGKGSSAVANIPILVKGEPVATSVAATGKPSPLPVWVHTDGMDKEPWYASGWMGDTGNIKMNEKSTTNPYHGTQCIEVKYTAANGWGGVVWQSPANDWGDQPGGWDLTGATKLSFYARGQDGNEKIKIGFGVLGSDKPFFDTDKGEAEFTLTNEWKQYSINLAGKNLKQIKTGFMWVVAGQGKPITFYLDDIVYEGANGAPRQSNQLVSAKSKASPKGEKSQLPMPVFTSAMEGAAWIPSGYMGNAGAIKMDARSTNNPHTGNTCMQVNYNAAGNWGGVVWQHPANDWGDQRGGFDLTGAKQLSFWARGEKGGEKIKISFGLLGRDKPYHDTATGDAEITLTSDWKQYTINLAGKDMSCIKTGFSWVVAGQGTPLTFYFDDVVYE